MSRRPPTREAATTTVELVGMVAAAAVLTAVLALGMRAAAPNTVREVGTRLERLVAGEARQSTRAHWSSSRTQQPVRRFRAAEERRAGSGDRDARVSRDDLRLTPTVPPIALWEGSRALTTAVGGATTRADVRACLICAGTSWHVDPHSGLHATADLTAAAARSTPGPTVGLDAGAQAHLALVAVEAGVTTHHTAGAVSASGSARARALIGADLDARATIDVGAAEQSVELRGGAMAGAVVRAEAKAGIELLGVAIEQSGRAEGWAGVGARGVVAAHRSEGRIDWRFGWGAALGLGGAAEWSGSIDISRVPTRHRRLARDALAAGLLATLPGGVGLLSYATPLGRND